jgi:hypothetical protein
VFIGTIIYMGVHEEPVIEMYWNTDFNKGPLHTIATQYHSAALSKLRGFAISYALRVIKE